MNTLTIEMFSKTETKVFGIAMLGFVLICLFLFLLVEGIVKMYQLKNENLKLERTQANRRYEVDITDFEQLGKEALRQQRMKSFIAETSADRLVEFTVDEILEEVKNR